MSARANVTFSLGAESDDEIEDGPPIVASQPIRNSYNNNSPAYDSRLLIPGHDTSLSNSPIFSGIELSPADTPYDTPSQTPVATPVPTRPVPLRSVSAPGIGACDSTVIQVDPIHNEAVHLAHGVTKKSIVPQEPSAKRGILSNLLQLHNVHKSKSDIKPNRKPSAKNLSSQSLQAFFGIGTARSSMSNDGSERKVAAVIESILKRQTFLRDLSRAFIMYGAPSHRMEANLRTAAQVLEVDASFATLPGLMLISFTCQETHTSETVLLRVSPGYEMHKLDLVVNIYQRVIKEDLLLVDADDELQDVLNSPPLYPPWAELLSYGVGAFGSAPMLFGGSIWEAVVAGGLGLIVGLMTLLARRFSSYANIFELSTAVLVSFVATAIRHQVCYWPVVLSATVNLLPGLSLTVAVMDLASKNMVSGSVRLFYSLLTAFILGFGLSLGSKLWLLFDPGEINTSTCSAIAMDLHYRILFFIPATISFNIYLLAHPRQCAIDDVYRVPCLSFIPFFFPIFSMLPILFPLYLQLLLGYLLTFTPG
ncbi:pheromone-regulated protein prm10 [Entomophthora muscae]|uniref:Pheromone-regulated protein prm10 n=1 Tax=Entomophthora muscae TaxID=34485 RepID=A0ACC2UAT3_9FUNG|nr:pheromone-regulated protein prm10 [Entomophthora muscae]